MGAYPIPDAALDDRLGFVGTYVSRLAGPGLIERSGGIVRLSADVMP